jgi:hypothetical protein
VEFRETLLAARALAVRACGRLARAMIEVGDTRAAAGPAREGRAEARAPVEYRPADADLRLCRAWCLLGAGDGRAAAEEFAELRRGLGEGESWWAATCGLWRSLVACGEGLAADKLVARLRVEFPGEVDRRLPEVARAPGRKG